MARFVVMVRDPARLSRGEQIRGARVPRHEPGIQKRRRQQESDRRSEQDCDDRDLPGRDAEPHGGEEGGGGRGDEGEGAEEGLPVGAWVLRWRRRS